MACRNNKMISQGTAPWKHSKAVGCDRLTVKSVPPEATLGSYLASQTALSS